LLRCVSLLLAPLRRAAACNECRFSGVKQK
jgi:hypothetical protein